MGGLREWDRPGWNLFSAYCLRKTTCRWACADLRKQKENNSWFQNLTFFSFPPDMSCVLYLLHFLAWLSKLKIQELYLTFPPIWAREVKGEGTVCSRERMWALAMSRPKSKYWLCFWVTMWSCSGLLYLRLTPLICEVGIIPSSQGWHKDQWGVKSIQCSHQAIFVGHCVSCIMVVVGHSVGH